MRSVFIRIKKKTTNHTHKPADQNTPAWMVHQLNKKPVGGNNNGSTLHV
ncbi:hypothetical protein CHUUTOTORO_01850 [Serratia phage vB_SmaM-ChuuTotoro]|nr:hypothetical protein CHUUTOTORO_01850 [Serratia phage vB_SmaM-ChuuTotoro]